MALITLIFGSVLGFVVASVGWIFLGFDAQSFWTTYLLVSFSPVPLIFFVGGRSHS